MTEPSTPWEYESEEQKREMEEVVTKENCGQKLKLIQQIAKIARRELARTLGLSEATLRRIESGESLPTDAFMSRLHALCVIGRARFNKMSDAEREKISEAVGTSGGVVAGVGAGIGAIAAVGEVAGLSAAGITSGLAAIGGSMLAGIAVVAAIPVVTGVSGYLLVKGIKAICDANRLRSEEVNGKWEIRRDDGGAEVPAIV